MGDGLWTVDEVDEVDLVDAVDSGGPGRTWSLSTKSTESTKSTSSTVHRQPHPPTATTPYFAAPREATTAGEASRAV